MKPEDDNRGTKRRGGFFDYSGHKEKKAKSEFHQMHYLITEVNELMDILRTIPIVQVDAKGSQLPTYYFQRFPPLDTDNVRTYFQVLRPFYLEFIKYAHNTDRELWRNDSPNVRGEPQMKISIQNGFDTSKAIKLVSQIGNLFKKYGDVIKSLPQKTEPPKPG